MVKPLSARSTAAAANRAVEAVLSCHSSNRVGRNATACARGASPAMKHNGSPRAPSDSQLRRRRPATRAQLPSPVDRNAGRRTTRRVCRDAAGASAGDVYAPLLERQRVRSTQPHAAAATAPNLKSRARRPAAAKVVRAARRRSATGAGHRTTTRGGRVRVRAADSAAGRLAQAGHASTARAGAEGGRSVPCVVPSVRSCPAAGAVDAAFT